MMIKKSEQPNKCRYSLMYRGFSVRKKANNAAQSSYKIRTGKVNVIKVFNTCSDVRKILTKEGQVFMENKYFQPPFCVNGNKLCITKFVGGSVRSRRILHRYEKEKENRSCRCR